MYRYIEPTYNERFYWPSHKVRRNDRIGGKTKEASIWLAVGLYIYYLLLPVVFIYMIL